MLSTPIALKAVNTTSFFLSLESSDFDVLQEKIRIVVYPLQPFMPKNERQSAKVFSQLQNWAKDYCKYPYYLHTPSGDLYIGLPPEVTPPVIEYDNHSVTPRPFKGYTHREKVHFWLKVLLSAFFLHDMRFVSNHRFFFDMRSMGAKYKTVLRIELKHNFRNREAIEFQVVDMATRFKRVNYEEFEERRKSPFLNSIPYSTTASKGLDLFAFRQLKVSALKPDSEMYVEDTSEKYRSKVPFHSIKDLVQYEVSRCSTLYRFINRFITYIEALGVSAELKTPGMRSVEEVDELNLAIPDDFKISVIDGRKNPEPPIDEIISSLRKTSFRHSISPIAKSKHELDKGDVALYVMDYNDSDFDPDDPYALLAGEEDGYRMFKQDPDFASIPKQGLRINQKCYRRKAQEEKVQRSTERTLSPLRREDYLSYEPLNATDMDRNLSICVKQLFLKAVTLRPHLASALPLCQELTNTLFLNWQKQKKTYQIGYFTDGQFFAHQYEPRQIIEGLAPIIYKYTGRHFKDILRTLAKYHHHAQDPNAIDSLGNFKLIISPEFVWEIQDLEERYLYDEDKVHKNLKEKEKKRPRRAFLAKMAPNAANPHLVQQYNEYILTNVKEAELSFRDLIRKYGKDDDESGRTGFLKSVFGVKVTSPSVLKFFNTCCNVPVGAEKPNDVFKLHKGIWLAPQEMQYFVGRKSGYKDYEQEKGFGMRKIIPHAGAFDGTLFFSMLKVDFVRHREYTVYPFPYKLIDIAMEVNNSLT